MKTSATHLHEAWQWMGIAIFFWLVAAYGWAFIRVALESLA
ncbi:hypothetical protein QTI05_22520 [Variovorax sp. J22R193]|nr:hypothetical protein [Variovorax sp. J22R193]MDM0041832.1 hypothetical protein [Variovorax sp. J22R193]